MTILEFFGTDHRHEEIDEEQQRDNRGDDCFHAVPLQFLAKADVKRAHEKKHDDDSDKD
jgi:hypothetical protein